MEFHLSRFLTLGISVKVVVGRFDGRLEVRKFLIPVGSLGHRNRRCDNSNRENEDEQREVYCDCRRIWRQSNISLVHVSLGRASLVSDKVTLLRGSCPTSLQIPFLRTTCQTCDMLFNLPFRSMMKNSR